MKQLVILFLFALVSVSAKEFELPMPTKCEGHYAKRIKHFVEENKRVKKGGIVMLGDSITEGFRMHFAPKEWDLVNRGISGDCIGAWKYQGAFDRLDVSVHAVKPRKVFIAIGTNDIVNWFPELQNASQKQMAKGYVKLIKEIQSKNSGVKVYIQSVFPTAKKYVQYNGDVVKFNEKLKRIAKKMNLPYIDTHSALVDESGALKLNFTRDGVHLTNQAYRAWVNVLKPYMDE